MLFSGSLDSMHISHHSRAPVAAREGMEILECLEILAPDAAVFGEQRGEVAQPGTESIGLFQQHSVVLNDGYRDFVASATRPDYIRMLQ